MHKKLFSEEFKIFSHLTEHEKYALYTFAKKLPEHAVCVEIGSFLGSSSCFIAAGITENSKLYCIDTWGNHAMKYVETDIDANERDTYDEFNSNTNKYKNKIVQLRGWSYDKIIDLKTQVNKIDFLFIDGDHNYEGVKKDWDLYNGLLENGSVVAFHDVEWAEGVNKVISENVVFRAELIYKLPNLAFYRICQ